MVKHAKDINKGGAVISKKSYRSAVFYYQKTIRRKGT